MNNISCQEVICIQGGQAGIQSGQSMWELLTVEHDISPSGKVNSKPQDISFTTFFSQSSNDQYFPRALLFDTEPTVIDEVRSGYYRKLFHPDMLVNGLEDASNNFARGYISEAKRLMFIMVEKVRSLIENCDNFQGFLVQSGTAGGTGSGLLSALMEHLLTEYAGRISVQLSIFPGQRLSNCIVQPYNCMLASEKLIHNSDLNILVDNEILYSIACNQLKIERPCFSNINRIISPILSALTAPIRFCGMLNSDLKEISTNLVPYPSLHYPLVSYSPLISTDKLEHNTLNNEYITRSLFEQDNQFIDVDLRDGYFLSTVLLYRGNCDLSNILKTVQLIKNEKDFKWVDWCPTGFKISHTLQRAVNIPLNEPLSYDKAASMISNHNGIAETFLQMETKFNILFSKRSYLHWYIGEGMEESEFTNAVQEVQTIPEEYLNIVESSDESLISEDDDEKISLENVKDSKVSKIEDAVEVTVEKDKIRLQSLYSGSSMRSEKIEGKFNENNGVNIKMLDTNNDMYLNIIKGYSKKRNTTNSNTVQTNVANHMYEVCERKYNIDKFKTLKSNKPILREISILKSCSSENFIRKIFRKNINLFNKFMHSQRYDLTTC